MKNFLKSLRFHLLTIAIFEIVVLVSFVLTIMVFDGADLSDFGTYFLSCNIGTISGLAIYLLRYKYVRRTNLIADDKGIEGTGTKSCNND